MQVFPRVAAECQGAEFQFLEEKFGAKDLAVRLEVKSAPDYNAPRIYPPATEAKKVDGWWTLKL